MFENLCHDRDRMTIAVKAAVRGGSSAHMDLPTTDWRDVVLEQAPYLEGIGPLPPEKVFSGQPRSEAAFGGERGLLQGPAFTATELETIRELIKAQLIENAYRTSPALASAIADMPLRNYHEVATDDDHPRLLSKRGRILSAAAVDVVKQMSFFDYVRAAFGTFYLSDEEAVGHEQICFRIARPNRREDVGTLHRDSWFWQYFGFPVPEGISRVKVWVPVCGDPTNAGLLLAPGSHLRPAGYRTETVDGKLGFIPEADPTEVALYRYRGEAGQPIMFNYDLLHVGALTRGAESRVSFEITIMFRSDRA